MKICVFGNPSFSGDINQILIDSGFKIGELFTNHEFAKYVSGATPVKIDWKDFSGECVEREGKFGKYNAAAPSNRAKKLAQECDALILLTQDKIEKEFQKLNKPIYKQDQTNYVEF